MPVFTADADFDEILGPGRQRRVRRRPRQDVEDEPFGWVLGDWLRLDAANAE
jgi:hypothetical protein